ncbi:Mitochondrial distribution and morphology protein 31 [Apiospora marii]|uniref:Mitochondrial distribution and morphology protein 31 n=1 Tax=Apiospora marii TaxID=335849 RepID=UPI0031315445
MSSTARTMLFGRQTLRSLYESLDFFTSKVSSRQSPADKARLGQSNAFSTAAHTRPWHQTPWNLNPRFPKTYGYNARRSFTSSGLLLVGCTPASSTGNTVASCTAAAETAIIGGIGHNAHLAKLARQGFARGCTLAEDGLFHIAVNQQRRTQMRKKTEAPEPVATPKPDTKPSQTDAANHGYSGYFHLPHLPHLPHRPTREELLAAANGFWQRTKVRLKWVSIRSMRPWNTDEWGAFLSFFLFGHLVWILLGTTTFVSLIIFSINTVFAQETLAKKIGDYLTQSAGVNVVFENAIVPRWKDGVISFRNVFVSRRPGQIKSTVSKGSSSSAAAVAAAERGTVILEEDDGNYTQFDITINTVNVTLSFAKWWNGKGLLKDVEVKGVRGVVDRTHVHWSSVNIDPLSYRHEHQPGDFEIDSFRLEDLLVTVHQPDGFRPYSVSIYSGELPQLRKRYLFYDLLSATHMSGSYDGSLFTIHPRQVHGVAAGQERVASDLGEPEAWKKFSRLRIDGLKIDHLNRGDEGPFGWIYEGNVDIVADVMFPADDDESITKVVTEFYDRLEEAVTSNRYLHLLDSNTRRNKEGEAIQDASVSEASSVPDEANPEAIPSTPAPPEEQSAMSILSPASGPPRYLVMDLRIHLNDVKASVPVFTSHLSYVNQALVRPIVAYINAKRTYIPIGCRIVKRSTDFDGSWTVFDCGLMNDVSAEVYSAFANDVEDQQSRVRRLKKVGFWTLSLAVHALFMGMAGNVI